MADPGSAVTLLEAAIGGFVGLTASLGLIKMMIWKGNKETKDELKSFEKANSGEHTKIFNKLGEHSLIINRYASNEAFYKALEKLAQDGVSVVEEETEEKSNSNSNPNPNNELDLGCLIQVILESIKGFAKDVLLIGIIEVSDESVTSKINAIKAKIRAKCDKVFDIKSAKEFRRKYNPIITAYAKEVKNISTDVCNDKNGNFKDITIVLTRRMISRVIRFGLPRIEKI